MRACAATTSKPRLLPRGNRGASSSVAALPSRRVLYLRGDAGSRQTKSHVIVTAIASEATPSPPLELVKAPAGGFGENTFLEAVARQGTGARDGVTLDDLLAKNSGGYTLNPKFGIPQPP